ncbi:MAG: alpha-glucan family phosphorylase [Cyanobacteria bacterium]|nr:alpha-glucan family phosphorylase [Cyanobacteriota bacterium]
MSLPMVAYFSMEMAIDQSLYTYAGGLGYLAGSHMHSAGYLDLPLVGVTMLWSYGYGIQTINSTTNTVELSYEKQQFPNLQDPGISAEITIFGQKVIVKAFHLPRSIFGTAPIYFLTTDIPENPPEIREYSGKLYDGTEKTRIAQEIILGIGGLQILRKAGIPIQVVHLNEGHALPAAFQLLADFGGDLNKVKEHLVFTTHTPVAAGNEAHSAHLLADAGFFAGTSVEQAIQLGGDDFSLTVAALRMSRIANGVSQLHGQVANNMWSWVQGRCPIVAITNAVDLRQWQDPRIKAAGQDSQALSTLKKTMKQELFDQVKQRIGLQLNPDVLTLVWARRFTEYKRAWLIFQDEARLRKLLENNKIQLLFSGKFHPEDTAGKNMFNKVIEYAEQFPNVGILTGYDLSLSGYLKRGADIWLNTPLRPMEASGTSGMSANMNGALHFSTYDGWAVEGTFHGINGFIINENSGDDYLPVEERHRQDYESMMSQLEDIIIPAYYGNTPQWTHWMREAIQTAEAYFHSDRMVIEYYNRLYKTICL